MYRIPDASYIRQEEWLVKGRRRSSLFLFEESFARVSSNGATDKKQPSLYLTVAERADRRGGTTSKAIVAARERNARVNT